MWRRSTPLDNPLLRRFIINIDNKPLSHFPAPSYNSPLHHLRLAMNCAKMLLADMSRREALLKGSMLRSKHAGRCESSNNVCTFSESDDKSWSATEPRPASLRWSFSQSKLSLTTMSILYQPSTATILPSVHHGPGHHFLHVQAQPTTSPLAILDHLAVIPLLQW